MSEKKTSKTKMPEKTVKNKTCRIFIRSQAARKAIVTRRVSDAPAMRARYCSAAFNCLVRQ